MAGEPIAVDTICVYLSRLRGAPVEPGEPLTLRSVERAAFASWVRKSNILIKVELLTSGAPFTVEQLLSTGMGQASSESVSAWRINADVPTGLVSGKVGIDIEIVDALPAADDYREHPFYQDNFTMSEISYCVRQADVRASFCGTWAAKEAILKTGILSLTDRSLRAIEITRDADGRPLHPNCAISISHTPTTAVAVCLAGVR